MVENRDFTAKQFFVGLLRHWFLFLFIITLSLGATLLYYMLKTPSYTSTARILFEDRKSVLTNISTVNTGQASQAQANAQRRLSSQIQYLKSLDMAKKVGKFVKFSTIREFRSVKNPNETSYHEYFLKKLTVKSLSNSNVIEVSYTAERAEMAAKILKTITDVYKLQKSNEGFSANNEASNWLAGKVAELQTKQRNADAKVVDYRIKNGIFQGQNNQKLLSQQLTALNNNIVTVASARAEAVARANLINRLLERNGNLDSAQDVLNSTVIQQYRQQVLTIQRNIAQLSETLLPSHPRMQSLNAELTNVNGQIRVEARNIMLSLRNEVEISTQRERSLKAELSALKNQEAGSLLNEVGLNALLRDAATNRTLLDSYMARYREADVRNKTDLASAQVHIISQATVPQTQSGIKRSMMFIIVAIAAFIFALIISTLRILKQYSGESSPTKTVKHNNKNSKNKLSSPNDSNSKVDAKNNHYKKAYNTAKTGNASKDWKQQGKNIEYYLPSGNISFGDLSFMVAIPNMFGSRRQNKKIKNDILSHLNTEYADRFIELTDNLMTQSGTDFQKHFMVSGIDDGGDTNETLLNLGRILDVKGAKTLILDLDENSDLLPRSTLENASFGFSDVIKKQCYYQDCLIDDKKSNLQFLLAGTNIRGLDGIILSEEMEEFLDELDQVYDVILVHAKDINEKHITDFIDGQIDLTLMVADWEDRATERLENALLTLKEYQGSDFGLLLTGANMNEFDHVISQK